MAEFRVAEVRIWDRRVGAVAEDPRGQIIFEYDPQFARSGLELSPRHLPLLLRGPVSFPELRRVAGFRGLPGLLADALPDGFGGTILTRYLAHDLTREEPPGSVERLRVVGRHAVGALEFHPPAEPPAPIDADTAMPLDAVVAEARDLVAGRHDTSLPWLTWLSTSAGGANPKALMLWNEARSELRPGFATPAAGDEPWLIKLDGVGHGNGAPPESGPACRIEYAYHRMAAAGGVRTVECRLLEYGGLAHFASRRFDRVGETRLHWHSLGGLEHMDAGLPGTFSYEQYLRTCRLLGLPDAELRQAFRRAVFNVVAVNRDDHVRNFGFLMDPSGEWSLAPAYDLTHARGEGNGRRHQLSLAGKQEGFLRDDLLVLGRSLGLRRDGADVLDEVIDAVHRWPEFAEEAGLPDEQLWAIGAALRHREFGPRAGA